MARSPTTKKPAPKKAPSVAPAFDSEEEMDGAGAGEIIRSRRGSPIRLMKPQDAALAFGITTRQLREHAALGCPAIYPGGIVNGHEYMIWREREASTKAVSEVRAATNEDGSDDLTSEGGLTVATMRVDYRLKQAKLAQTLGLMVPRLLLDAEARRQLSAVWMAFEQKIVPLADELAIEETSKACESILLDALKEIQAHLSVEKMLDPETHLNDDQDDDDEAAAAKAQDPDAGQTVSTGVRTPDPSKPVPSPKRRAGRPRKST